MRRDESARIAGAWLDEALADAPDYLGALLHGSAAWLPPDGELPPGSDLDVLALFAGDALPAAGKRHAGELLLDVTPLPPARFASAEAVLAEYNLAGSFRSAAILRDPAGRLAPLCAAVEHGFAERRWVIARVDQAAANALRHLASAGPDDALHARVTAWLFGTGVLAHVLLVAGLRNPTVRRRFEASAEMLRERGRPSVQEELLRLLGSADLTAGAVAGHVDALEAVFDLAASVARTPFFFSADITPGAKAIAIDGSRASVAAGFHREAVFWIGATFARCRQIVAADAPAELARVDAPLRAFLADLGIHTDADLAARVDTTQAALPRIRAIALEMIDEDPAIRP